MSLLVLYFSPSDLLTPDASFEAISERLIVPPVVETLVYSKVKTSVGTCAPCHMVHMRSLLHVVHLHCCSLYPLCMYGAFP